MVRTLIFLYNILGSNLYNKIFYFFKAPILNKPKLLVKMRTLIISTTSKLQLGKKSGLQSFQLQAPTWSNLNLTSNTKLSSRERCKV